MGKNRRPIHIQNKFKALEVSDRVISPKASDAKPDENSSLIINADRSTPTTLADQLAEYRSQHKQKFISQFTTAASESSTQPSTANQGRSQDFSVGTHSFPSHLFTPPPQKKKIKVIFDSRVFYFKSRAQES